MARRANRFDLSEVISRDQVVCQLYCAILRSTRASEDGRGGAELGRVVGGRAVTGAHVGFAHKATEVVPLCNTTRDGSNPDPFIAMVAGYHTLVLTSARLIILLQYCSWRGLACEVGAR